MSLAAALLAVLIVNPLLASDTRATTGLPSAALHALLDEWWELRLREEPLLATFVGDHRYGDRMPSVTDADRGREDQALRGFEARLQKMDRAALAADDRVSYDMLAREVKDGLAELRFRVHRLPLTAEAGFHSGLARLPTSMPLRTVNCTRPRSDVSIAV